MRCGRGCPRFSIFGVPGLVKISVPDLEGTLQALQPAHDTHLEPVVCLYTRRLSNRVG
jgi:hypothetical protein